MNHKYSTILLIIIFVFILFGIGLSLDVGDHSDCQNGEFIITESGQWVCRNNTITTNYVQNYVESYFSNINFTSWNITFWNLTGTNLYPSDFKDNVGIGTTTPSEKLDVVGNVSVNGTVKIGSWNMYEDVNGTLVWEKE